MPIVAVVCQNLPFTVPWPRCRGGEVSDNPEKPAGGAFAKWTVLSLAKAGPNKTISLKDLLGRDTKEGKIIDILEYVAVVFLRQMCVFDSIEAVKHTEKSFFVETMTACNNRHFHSSLTFCRILCNILKACTQQ